MKRIRTVSILAAILLFLCLLSGCGEKTLRGEVTAVNSDGSSGPFSFVLEQENGKTVTVRTGENTHIFSWIPEASESDLRTGTGEGFMVSVTGRIKGSQVDASQVEIEGLLIRDAYTFSDGTKADLLMGLNHNSYCLPDGTELLQVQCSTDPRNVHVVGTESLDTLSPEAQQRIVDYYDAQGILYDEYETLQYAYTAWYILREEFDGFLLGQEIVPTASSEEIIYFMTVVTAPDRDTGGHSETRFGAAFDKQTGEAIPATELFTCEPEVLISRLAELCRWEDEAEVEKMKENFRPEYVVFFPDGLEIIFPGGVLTEKSPGFVIGCDYRAGAADLLQPWAVPDGSGTPE